MPLSLPARFKDDIQSKDTALFPVVAIGSPDDGFSNALFLSTNKHTAETAGIPLPFKPLLLNIPSLKESIDIEKRNYKISSVNLDISNFPYEGKRFSELIDDKSLINMECRIFWVSPSVIDIDPYDYNPDWLGNTSAFQVYFGTIRRYDMTDEKIKLIVEDKSQATFHKNLPTTNLGTGSEVSDKYKNKPIPMVYGHVDKSPCVIKIETNPNIPEYSALKNIIIDSVPITSFEEDQVSLPQYGSLNISGGLFVGDSSLGYSPCARTFMYDLTTELFQFDLPYIDDTNQNYSYDTENATINLITDSNNDVKRGILRGIIPRSPVDVKINTDVSPYNGYVAIQNHNISDYTSQGTGYDWQPDEIENASPEALLRIINNNIDDGLHLQAFITSDLSDYHGVKIELSPTFCGFDADSYFIGAYFSKYGTSTIGEFKNYPNVWAWFNYEALYYGNIGEWLDNSQGWFSNTSLGNNNNQENPFTKKLTNAGVPSSIIDFNMGVTNYQTDPATATELPVHIDIWSANIFHVTYVDKLVDRDFYASVQGRKNDNGLLIDAPVEIIGHIISEISDISFNDIVDQIYLEDIYAFYQGDDSHLDLRYGFTVDKKINSKKLIENIASTTPYIIRFDSSGKLKFNVIPEREALPSNIEVQTINEDDVINFSFSRTKIEDVYTKVVLKYRWDYASGKFNRSVETNVEEHIFSSENQPYGYYYGYYGFKKREGDVFYSHDESTLVIDDERGKYIRGYTTAKAFVDWYLKWSCNQHLKMKIKLPLKYMYLEIGDFVVFDEILGGVKPYGIDYRAIDYVNGQAVFKNFLITSTNKTLEWVQIECVQTHSLEDCQGNNYDCAGVCDGLAEVDDCGVCGGVNSTCVDCGGNICNNNGCQSGAVCEDTECLYVMCEEVGCASLADSQANCPADCEGTPLYEGGSAVLDECGVCNGNGMPEGACDCDGNVLDDCSVCGGDNATLDVCGICNGNGLDCAVVSNAGDNQTVTGGSTVYLSGTDSYVPNPPPQYDNIPTIYGFKWLIIENSTGETGWESDFDQEFQFVTNDNPITASFISPDVDGGLIRFKLIVYAEQEGVQTSSDEDSVIITIQDDPPITDCHPLITEFRINSDNANDIIFTTDQAVTCNPVLQNQPIVPRLVITRQNIYEISDMKIKFNAPGSIVHPNPLVSQLKLSLIANNPVDIDLIEIQEEFVELEGVISVAEEETSVFFDFPNSITALELLPGGSGTDLTDEWEWNDYHPWPQLVTVELDIKAYNGGIGAAGIEMEYVQIFLILLEYRDCAGEPGDTDANGGWNVQDIVILANCVLADNCDDIEALGLGFGCAGDVNLDGGYNVLDIVKLANCILEDSCGG